MFPAITTKIFAAAIIALTVTSGAQATGSKQVGQTTLTQDFVESDMSWQGRPNPGFVLRW